MYSGSLYGAGKNTHGEFSGIKIFVKTSKL